MNNALKHIYFHVPFCDGKCLYCAFYSTVYSPDKAEKYLAALSKEFDSRLSTSTHAEPETIYVGGGTPSILNTDQFKQLIQIILQRISTTQLKEWTVEANPGTLTPEKIRILTDAGINRVSFGAQSFDNKILGAIGRRHSAADIIKSVEAVRAAGIENIGLDLIANLPGVDHDTWTKTLYDAIELEPKHVSIYDLSLEKGTVLHDQVRDSRIHMPIESAQLKMLETAELLLAQAGFIHYEISNYARPGFEARHNVSCWKGEDYLGLGPSASSRVGKKRWSGSRGRSPSMNKARHSSIQLEGECPHEPQKKAFPQNPIDNETEETLSVEEDLTERFIFGFRLEEGVDIEAFCQKFEPVPEELRTHWTQTIYKLREDGLLEEESGRWKLTKQGRYLADHVVRELV